MLVKKFFRAISRKNFFTSKRDMYDMETGGEEKMKRFHVISLPMLFRKPTLGRPDF
jgi:hypothetical protein